MVAHVTSSLSEFASSSRGYHRSGRIQCSSRTTSHCTHKRFLSSSSQSTVCFLLGSSMLALGPLLGSTAAQCSVNNGDGRSAQNQGSPKIEPIHAPYQNTPIFWVEHPVASLDPPDQNKTRKLTGGTSGLSNVHSFARPPASAHRSLLVQGELRFVARSADACWRPRLARRSNPVPPSLVFAPILVLVSLSQGECACGATGHLLLRADASGVRYLAPRFGKEGWSGGCGNSCRSTYF